MFICNSPNFLHAIPLFIWATVSAWCNKNRPKGLCLWTWPSWPLLHSWGLEGARPCSTYHASKWSHSISRLLRYKWNTYNNVCCFRLLIAKAVLCTFDVTEIPCHGLHMNFGHKVDHLHIIQHKDTELPAYSTLHIFFLLFCGVCSESLSQLAWCYWTEHQLLAPQLVILMRCVKALKLTSRQTGKGWHFPVHPSISREN